MGRGRALELLLAGDPIPAAEAYRIGLVNAVVPQAELLDYCRGWLGKVLANGPLALGLVLDAVDTGLACGLEEGLRFEAAAFGVSAATEDRRKVRARFWRSGARRLQGSEICRKYLKASYRRRGCALRSS